jgi:protein TonB
MTRSMAYAFHDHDAAARAVGRRVPQGLWPEPPPRVIEQLPSEPWLPSGPDAPSANEMAHASPAPSGAAVRSTPAMEPLTAGSERVTPQLTPQRSGTFLRAAALDATPLQPLVRPPPLPAAPRIESLRAPPARLPIEWLTEQSRSPSRSSSPSPSPVAARAVPAAAARARTTPRAERIVLYLAEDSVATFSRRRLSRVRLRSVGACGALIAGLLMLASSQRGASGHPRAVAVRGMPSAASKPPVQKTASPTQPTPALLPQPQPASVPLAATRLEPATNTASTPTAAPARASFRYRARDRRAARHVAPVRSARQTGALPPEPADDDSDALADNEPGSDEAREEDDVSAEATRDDSSASTEAAARAAPQSSAAHARPSVTHAQLISSRRPQYPDSALQRGIEGTVLLSFTIDAGGAVRDPVVERSSPAGVFDRAALQAIRSARYQPRTEDGVPVVTPQARKRYVFHVQPRK